MLVIPRPRPKRLTSSGVDDKREREREREAKLEDELEDEESGNVDEDSNVEVDVTANEAKTGANPLQSNRIVVFLTGALGDMSLLPTALRLSQRSSVVMQVFVPSDLMPLNHSEASQNQLVTSISSFISISSLFSNVTIATLPCASNDFPSLISLARQKAKAYNCNYFVCSYTSAARVQDADIDEHTLKHTHTLSQVQDYTGLHEQMGIIGLAVWREKITSLLVLHTHQES
jgi:hypothetical protein